MEQVEESFSSDDTFNIESDSQEEDRADDKSDSEATWEQNEIFQEYHKPILMAYGRRTQGQDSHDHESFNLLPYPNISTSSDDFVMENKSFIIQSSFDHIRFDNHIPNTTPFQCQTLTRDSSSSTLSIETAPPSSSSSPQFNITPSSEIKDSHHVSSFQTIASPVRHEGCTKNKYNLTVDTKITGLKHDNQLSPNNNNLVLTPYSESSNHSSISQYPPSSYYESNESIHRRGAHAGFRSSSSVTNQPNVVDWLTSNIQHQDLSQLQGNNVETLLTPSSATFSHLPTPPPSTAFFNPNGYHLPLVESSVLDMSPGFQLATSFAPVPKPCSELYNSQSLPMGFNLSVDLHFPSFGHFNSQESRDSNDDLSPEFGHFSFTNHEVSGEHRSTYVQPSNQNLINDSVTCEKPPSKKRRSSPIHIDFQKENIDPFFFPSASSTVLSPLTKRSSAAGSRLKPGPKAKSTRVQHPPPTPNLIGLKPSMEASGIPKDVLLCLYETVVDPDSRNSERLSASNKRYVCKLDGCGRSFLRKTAIESHLQTHLSDKPFICDVTDCNAAFVRQHDLRRHQHIHSNSKPHSCICGKGFARGDALIRHRQRAICIGSLGPRCY